MKILITGGAGFIGSHLAEELLERGNEIFVIDDLSTGSIENIVHLEKNHKFHLTIDTIMNEKTLDKLISQVDIVYHLAASVGVRYIIENPLKSLQINIKGTENVLELANRYKRKVLIASSSEIYGKSEKIPYKEDEDMVIGSTYISRWAYATSKAIDEFLSLAYFREKQLPVVIVRLFNTCGPRQTERYGMVIPRFIKQALLTYPITIFGDGKQTRCFSYVGDVIQGIISLMNEPKAEGEIFNLGNDEEINIENLAKKVKEIVQSKSTIEYIPYEKAYEKGFEDFQRRVPDLSKAKKLIGYQPKVNLDGILKKTIEYFKK